MGQEATGTQKTFQAAGKVADVIGANENVRGGIGLAVIIATGLFLPVMAIVNYVKNYTGENSVKDIELLLNGTVETPKAETITEKPPLSKKKADEDLADSPKPQAIPVAPSSSETTISGQKTITIKIPANLPSKNVLILLLLAVVIICGVIFTSVFHSHRATAISPPNIVNGGAGQRALTQPVAQSPALAKQSIPNEAPAAAQQSIPNEVTAPTQPTSPPTETPVPKKVANLPKVVFSDDFSGNSIDSAKWTTSGNTVIQDDGVMKVLTEVTDKGGNLTSKPFLVNPTGKITITHQVYLHYANAYFIGKTFITIGDLPTFAIQYANMSYSDANLSLIPRQGFFVSRNNARIDVSSAQADVSAAITPVWDTWFDEKITYDPTTGILELFINDVSQGTYNVGIMSSKSPTMTLAFSAWGWWTGHQYLMKNLKVTQIESDTQ